MRICNARHQTVGQMLTVLTTEQIQKNRTKVYDPVIPFSSEGASGRHATAYRMVDSAYSSL